MLMWPISPALPDQPPCSVRKHVGRSVDSPRTPRGRRHSRKVLGDQKDRCSCGRSRPSFLTSRLVAFGSTLGDLLIPHVLLEAAVIPVRSWATKKIDAHVADLARAS